MYPSNLDSVSVVTFTDGLDNNSTSPNLKALEGQSFAGLRLSEYQTYLQSELSRRNIREKPITAYSVGVQGKDVFDNAAFSTSIFGAIQRLTLKALDVKTAQIVTMAREQF
jgi:hypothetical protein